MQKGWKWKTHEVWLKSLVGSAQTEEAEGKYCGHLQLPIEESVEPSTDLFLRWQWENPREYHGAATWEGQAEYQEKVLHQRVVDMEQAPQGNGHGHSPKLPEF